jgi:hypothetical protein
MVPDIHMHEKLLLEHRQQLQREAERRHMLARAGLRRHSRMSYLVRRIGKLFVARSSSMKPNERIDESFANCTEEPGREPELQEIRG